MGIKEAKLSVGGEAVWEGTVDKGCGNQVFDYSTTIPLSKVKSNEGNSDGKMTSEECRIERETTKIITRNKNQNTQGIVEDSSLTRGSGHSTESKTGAHVQMDFTDQGLPQERRLNKSNSNNNGEEDGGEGELQKSIAFEIDLDLFPSQSKQTPVRKADQAATKGSLKKSVEGKTNKKAAVKETGVDSRDKAKGSSKFVSETTPSINLAQDSIEQSLQAGPQEMDSIDFGNQLGLGASVSDSLNPEDPRQTIGCETRVLVRSSSDNLVLPTVDDSIQIFATPRASLDASRGKNMNGICRNKKCLLPGSYCIKLKPERKLKTRAVSIWKKAYWPITI